MKFDLTISNILSIFTWFLKNQVWNFFQKSNWTNLIFSLFQTRFLQAIGSKDQVPNRLKIKFVQHYLWKKFSWPSYIIYIIINLIFFWNRQHISNTTSYGIWTHCESYRWTGQTQKSTWQIYYKSVVAAANDKKTSWEPVKHYDFLPPFSSKNSGFSWTCATLSYSAKITNFE